MDCAKPRAYDMPDLVLDTVDITSPTSPPGAKATALEQPPRIVAGSPRISAMELLWPLKLRLFAERAIV